LAAVAVSASPARAGDFLSFPIPEDALVIPAVTGSSEDASIGDLIALYSAATGQFCVMDEETRNIAQNTKISSQPGEKLAIAPDRVQVTFEHMLASQGFALEVLTHTQPRLFAVKSFYSRARQTIKSAARLIASDEVSKAAAHPAMFFTTVVQLEGVDARQVANSMRQMVADPNTTMVLSTSQSSIVLTASGPALLELHNTLAAIQAAHAQQAEAARQAQARQARALQGAGRPGTSGV